MASEARTRPQQSPVIQATRSARSIHDRARLEGDAATESASRFNQCWEALHAPSAPNIIRSKSPPPQQTISGSKTATAARPVSVSCARAKPMLQTTIFQTKTTRPPQNGITKSALTDPPPKQTTLKVVSNDCLAPPTIIKET